MQKLKNYLPLILATTLSLAAIAYYFILTKNWQKMWHGTVGDELFLAANFNRIIHGQYFSDFYTGWLPPFYPPLYFWLTGTIAKLVGAANGITAAKIGVMVTFVTWFLGSYIFQSLGWKLITKSPLLADARSKEGARGWLGSGLYFLLFPLIYFFTIHFPDIVTKPYEAVSALLCIIFLWLFNSYLSEPPLLADARSKEGVRGWLRATKPLLFFGISGGLLFLTYYFWWFILIPALFVIVLTQKKHLIISSGFLVLLIGTIMFLVASPYLIPLFTTYAKLGMENWQPLHFVYSDLTLYAPWLEFSIPGLFYLIGFATIIIELTKYWRKPKSTESEPPALIKSNAIILIFCYLYFFINLAVFFSGHTPWQASKPFYFLGGAALISSAAYGLTTIYAALAAPRQGGGHLLSTKKFIRAFVFLITLLLLILQFFNSLRPNLQLTKINLQPSPASQLATDIKSTVPDAESKIWLSSGNPELNAYINLNYFVAHNAHFSHPASHFSQRLDSIRAFVSSNSPSEFANQLSTANPPITALLLYYNQSTNTYPLFFRVDDFGNGSREVQYDLNPELLTELNKVYDKNNWSIWIR